MSVQTVGCLLLPSFTVTSWCQCKQWDVYCYHCSVTSWCQCKQWDIYCYHCSVTYWCQSKQWDVYCYYCSQWHPDVSTNSGISIVTIVQWHSDVNANNGISIVTIVHSDILMLWIWNWLFREVLYPVVFSIIKLKHQYFPQVCNIHFCIWQTYKNVTLFWRILLIIQNITNCYEFDSIHPNSLNFPKVGLHFICCTAIDCYNNKCMLRLLFLCLFTAVLPFVCSVVCWVVCLSCLVRYLISEALLRYLISETTLCHKPEDVCIIHLNHSQ